MKKKIIITLSILLSIFLVYKTGVYLLYKSAISSSNNNYQEYIDGKTISIKNTEVDEYLEFDGYKVGNYFDKFIKRDDKNIEIYNLYEDDKIIAGFSTGISNSYLSYAKASKEQIHFYNTKGNLLYKSLDGYIKNNNIDNDIEFIKNITNYKSNINFFSSLSKVREDVSVRLFRDIVLPQEFDITYIDGSYSGIIFKKKDDKKNIISINIIHDNKVYGFNFMGNMFNEKLVREVISTVKFN